MTYRDECAGCVQKSQEIDRLSVKSTPKWKLKDGESFFAFISSVFAFVGAVATTVLFLGPRHHSVHCVWLWRHFFGLWFITSLVSNECPKPYGKVRDHV